MAVETRVIIDANASNAIREIGRLDQAAGDADTTINELDGTTVAVDTSQGVDGMDRLRQMGDDAVASVKALSDTPVTIDVDSTQLAELDAGATGAKGKVDEFNKSADSSRSVTANMVGNATQDLGALGGVAGSAGVAIGQMGEYMADARASGEGFGSILSNFGTQALPIAAIGVGVTLITKAFEASKKRAKELQEATKAVVDALLDAQDAGEGAADALDHLADTKVTDILKGLGETKLDTLATSMEELGLGWGDLVGAFSTGEGPIADAIAQFDQMNQTIELSAVAGQVAYDPWKLLAEQYGKTTDEVKELYAQYKVLDSVLGDQLGTQQQALDSGGKLTDMRKEYAAQEIKSTEAAKKAKEETERLAEEQEKAAEEADKWAIAVAGANQELGNLGSTFSQIGIRGGALADVFEVGSSGVEAASAIRDIDEAIGGLNEAAKGVDLSKPLDPTNLKADKLLDALDGLRPQIQEKIQTAFSLGGPVAAKETADAYVSQIVEAMGGKLTPGEVEQMLGLNDLSAQIRIALEISQVENVKRQLAVLTGMSGETPLTASIALALDAGTLSPEAAEILVQNALGDAGVTIPTTLDTPDTPAAIALANDFLRRNPATMPVEADVKPATDDIKDVTDTKHETTITAKADKKTAADDIVAEETKYRVALIQAEANTTVAKYKLDLLEKPLTAPLDVYVDDYPSASEIQRMIGRPRIPIDIVVGSSIRITGVRD